MNTEAMRVFIFDSKMIKGAKPCEQDYRDGADKLPSGFSGAREPLLWRMCLFDAGSACGTLLHRESVLRGYRNGERARKGLCR